MLLFQLSRLHFSWKKHVSLDVERSIVLLERLDTRGAWWQERKKLSLSHLLPEKHQHSPGLSHYNHLKQSWNKINTGVIFWAKSKIKKKAHILSTNSSWSCECKANLQPDFWMWLLDLCAQTFLMPVSALTLPLSYSASSATFVCFNLNFQKAPANLQSKRRALTLWTTKGIKLMQFISTEACNIQWYSESMF